ncbi:MAG: DUF349 domain-containing protein [Pseudomonadales bacterium]|nr:DUF349 domain-containing protein [Pseudomonadales bacterium]
MLRRFFKGRDRLNDPDPRVRREAVASLDTAGARARRGDLARLLEDDSDRAVRLAALERLDAIDVLVRVLDDAAIGDAVARRIEALARASGAALPAHPRLATGRLAAAPEAERTAAIGAITDPEQLIGMALKDRGSLRTSVLAHPALNTGTGLALLEKRSRGADKSLNRHARERLDALKRLQHRAAEASTRAEELVQALERTAAANERAAYERALHLYRECLAAIDRHDAARAELAPFGESPAPLAALRARLVAPEPPAEPVPAPPDLEAPFAPDEAGARATLESETHADASPAARATKADVWATTTDGADAAIDEPSTPIEGETDHAAGEAERAARRAATEAEAAARRAEQAELERLIEAAETALDAGEIGTARQRLAEARQRHDTLGAAAARALTRRLNRVSGRLTELKDWQTFATTPKREALCEAAQTLVDHPLPPPDQAERLKALRAAWRELGPVNRAREARLAERFDTLAEQAFETCRVYFAEQAELRRRNLAERQRICAELETYLTETDWQRADMKAAEQILRTARDSWLGCSPVDRQAGRAVEQQFEALQQQLHERLKAFWERNAAAKGALVAEAEELLADSADIEERINRAKGLQQRWRTIGAVLPRQRDQALWSSFRAACDGLFEARDSARASQQTEIRELAGQCAAVLDDFEHTLRELAPEAATEAQARTLAERLRDLDRLPPALRQPLAARRAELLDRHRNLVRQRAAAGRLARLAELETTDAQAPATAGATVALDTLRRLALRAEQAAGIAPPPEDEPLRLEVQVERLRAGLGGNEDEDPLGLAERWCALGPKTPDAEPLRARFFAALRARLR